MNRIEKIAEARKKFEAEALNRVEAERAYHEAHQEFHKVYDTAVDDPDEQGTIERGLKIMERMVKLGDVIISGRATLDHLAEYQSLTAELGMLSARKTEDKVKEVNYE